MRHSPGPSRRSPEERPRLVLQPRSKPVETAEEQNKASAIFGGAKPVDTAAREKEIEERMLKKREEDKERKEVRHLGCGISGLSTQP